MIENKTGYLVLTAIFLLLFFLSILLFERYKERIQPVLKEKDKPIMKFPWDTVIKGFVAGGFILFSRKLIYYFPFVGVIQTTSSIWWVNADILIFFNFSLFILLLASVFMAFGTDYIDTSMSEKIKGCLIGGLGFISFIILPIGCLAIMQSLKVPLDKAFILFICTPLLFLKMLVSGKYLGVFTSFLVGSFIIDRYKKLKFQITRRNAKYLIVPVLIVLLLFVYSINILPGDWQERFLDKIHLAKSDKEIIDLVDAANSIDDSTDKFNALKMIAAAGNIPWQKETCQQVIEVAITTKSIKERSSVIKELALTVAKTGDIPRAISVAEYILNKKIRNNVLKELREKIGKK
jgi:hypothetical protein